jgi:hypothetical protein
MDEARASDAEREVAAERLRVAAGEGRLDLEELAERLGAVYGATTRGELEPITADLPAPAESAAGEDAPRRTWLVAVFGGNDRVGRWHAGREVRVLNVFGGCDLDLRGAEIEGDRIDIVVVSIFGGSDIVVPEGMHVELSSFAVFGGDKLKLGGPDPAPGAPVVHVRCVSIFGGTDVVTRRGRSRRGPPEPPPLPPPP